MRLFQLSFTNDQKIKKKLLSSPAQPVPVSDPANLLNVIRLLLFNVVRFDFLELMFLLPLALF